MPPLHEWVQPIVFIAMWIGGGFFSYWAGEQYLHLEKEYYTDEEYIDSASDGLVLFPIVNIFAGIWWVCRAYLGRDRLIQKSLRAIYREQNRQAKLKSLEKKRLESEKYIKRTLNYIESRSNS